MPRLLVVLFGASIGIGASQTPTPSDVRNRLDAYLSAYEPALSALVAREQMTQTIEAEPTAARLRFGRPTIVEQRKLESEVAFVQLPGDSGWMGIRVVRKVDGKTVATTADALATVLRSDFHMPLKGATRSTGSTSRSFLRRKSAFAPSFARPTARPSSAAWRRGWTTRADCCAPRSAHAPRQRSDGGISQWCESSSDVTRRSPCWCRPKCAKNSRPIPANRG